MRFTSVSAGLRLLLAAVLLLCLPPSPWAKKAKEPDFRRGLPVEDASLSVEGPQVRISLPQPLQGPSLYLLFYSPDPDFDYSRATLLGATQRDYYVDPLSLGRMERAFYRALHFPEGLGLILDEIMIEDFEDGLVTLASYPGQDQQPNAWEVTSLVTYDSTLFSLMLYGNTWKIEYINPIPIATGDVWRAAVMAYDVGEIQAFGVGDGTDELFYVFNGTDLPTGTTWNTTFHSVAPVEDWALLNLPVATDWQIRYNVLPVIDRLFYVNDIDAPSGSSVSFFDEIHDITEDLPNVPQVFITAVGDSSQLHPTYQFSSTVIDPDSPTHTYFWDFGDSTFSAQPNPSHTYTSRGYRTASLIVMDDDSLFGDACVHLLPPPGTTNPEFTLNAAGDVMMGRRYLDPGGIIPTYGVNYIFERIVPMFGQAAQINMINLETQLSDQGYPHPTKEYIFRSSPESVSGLQFAGFDYVALGNNHTMDYMEPGLAQTIAVLDSAGLLFSGSGLNEYWATRPAFFSVDGIRVAVLSYCNRDGREDFLPPFLEAGYNKPGFAMFDEPTLEATIPVADSLADLIIVQAHVGTEYDPSPLERMGPEAASMPPEEWIRFSTEVDSIDRYLERRAIELGADVIIAHHPHVLQGFEVYQGKLIAHSMGNFAFDQNYWETYPTIILYFKASLDGFSEFSFRPVYIDDYVPTPATGELGEAIMRRLCAYSLELETDVAYDSTDMTGRIALYPSQVIETDRQVSASVSFQEEGNYWVSEPLRIEDPGFLSAIVSVSGLPPGTQIQLALGREILLMGSFEYEGGWLWNLNSDDEFLETMYPHSGTYCLAVRREEGQFFTYADLEDNIPIDPDIRYTIDGYLAGSNCRDARFGVAFYEYRFSGGAINVKYIDEQTGSFPWTRFYENMAPPNNGWFANIRCLNDDPQSGTGMAYFDDLALVEWTEDWTTIPAGFTPIPYPNESTYLQIRTDEAAASANITYRLTERTIQW